jgi:CDP-diacylglycerol--serine O-phosphatidyltransferase
VTDRWRIFANSATLANAVLGVGAVLYVLAGNKLWAMLLIVCAIAFDGMDGILSRRSRAPPSRFGRVADSVADSVSFGVAPAFLIAVHTGDVATWQPWEAATLAVAVLYLAAAVARLTYFTTVAHDRPEFLGVPTPQSTLGLVAALLFLDSPAFAAVLPLGLVLAGVVLSVWMVVPIRYPKIRRGSPLRLPMAVTAVAAALALVPLQFHLAAGSTLYEFAFGASLAFAVGVGSYYLLGPFTVSRIPTEATNAQ